MRGREFEDVAAHGEDTCPANVGGGVGGSVVEVVVVRWVQQEGRDGGVAGLGPSVGEHCVSQGDGFVSYWT